jgi:DNA modification methylase
VTSENAADPSVTQLSLDFDGVEGISLPSARPPAHSEEFATIFHGDCVEVMAAMPEASVDAIVCDPPYGLEFMGKEWDRLWTDRNGKESRGRGRDPFVSAQVERYVGGETAQAWHHTWALAAYRVLKPGGHLVAFGGTRTFHRLTCALEDAGFEIRDSILFWCYGSGFPKSKNIGCRCDESKRQTENAAIREVVSHVRGDVDRPDALPGRTEQDMLAALRGRASATPESEASPPQLDMLGVRSPLSPTTEQSRGDGVDVFSPLQRQEPGSGSREVLGQREGEDATGAVRPSESGVEGRGDLQADQRQLSRPALRPVSGTVSADGEEGRLRDGASARGGAGAPALPLAGGSGPSPEPQSESESVLEPRALPEQRSPQARGGHCETCGGLTGYRGFGTALKPAWEPIILARKPLSERNVAANVLRHGTGAINVDGCRIRTDENTGRPQGSDIRGGAFVGSVVKSTLVTESHALGRWPANLVLDEAAAALVDAQSGERPSSEGIRPRGTNNNVFGVHRDTPFQSYGDTGGASRFFYTAKADAEDRDGSKHPTVKPVDLMKWLIRLVTPAEGVVLDPFLGSGTTVYAARTLGIRSIGIEREAAYVEQAIWRLRQGVLL